MFIDSPNRARRRTRVHPQRGFALIEAMVAVLVFAVGVLGIARLQAVAVQETGTAALRTNASLLARNLIARIWLSDRTSAALISNFSSTPAGAGYTAWLATVSAANLPGVTSTTNLPVVTVSAVAGGGTTPVASTNVAITVYWKGPGDSTVHTYTESAQVK